MKMKLILYIFKILAYFCNIVLFSYRNSIICEHKMTEKNHKPTFYSTATQSDIEPVYKPVHDQQLFCESPPIWTFSLTGHML